MRGGWGAKPLQQQAPGVFHVVQVPVGGLAPQVGQAPGWKSYGLPAPGGLTRIGGSRMVRERSEGKLWIL